MKVLLWGETKKKKKERACSLQPVFQSTLEMTQVDHLFTLDELNSFKALYTDSPWRS
jgi:hypothetical protein